MGEPAVIAGPGELSLGWLTSVLSHAGAIGPDSTVSSVRRADIGTGQIGDNVRCILGYEGPPGPASVVCKFGSKDPTSAAVAVQLQLYEIEVAFYRELAPTVEVSRPHCYFAGVRPGTAEAVLVLEDLAPAEPGDQVAGCSVEQAALALDEAARLHGPRWGDRSLGQMRWLNRGGAGLGPAMPFVWDSFVERYGPSLTPATLAAGAHLAELVTAVDARQPRSATPVHYDFRLDNMLFATERGGRPLAVVDWQTVQVGNGVKDVAYFMGNAFEPELRRGCERGLVARYHRALVDNYGVDDYPLEECWTDYVANSYASLVMAAFASVAVGRTERGDAMFIAMANRSAQMAVDLDAPTIIRSR
jgi:hypothetical protein